MAAAKALSVMAEHDAQGMPASAVDDLIAATRDSEHPVVAMAMNALAMLHDPRALAFLSDALVDPSTDHQLVASALSGAGPRARVAESRLIAIVEADDQPMAVRDAAALALGESGADSERAIGALATALLLPREHLIEHMRSDGRDQLRWTAQRALEALAAAPASRRRVARVLLARMGTNDEALRVLCAKDPEVELIAPKLVALSHRGESMGPLIAHCLGDRAALAMRALPDLVEQTRAPYPRADAAHGLGAIRSPSAAPALVAQLARRSEDAHTVTAVLHALTRIGAKVDRAPIAALLERTCLGAAAAVTLVATGSDVATGTQRLDQLLDSPDADERGCAVTELAWAIADPGFATQRARLAALIGDPAWNVRVAALAAASQLGPAAEPLLPAIVAQLQPYRTHMEWQAISHALVAMKGAALPALPELLRLLVENPDGARMFYPAYVSILRAHPETADQIRAAIADEGYWARLLGEQVIEQAKLAP